MDGELNGDGNKIGSDRSKMFYLRANYFNEVGLHNLL
jgi:hypothetical protein